MSSNYSNIKCNKLNNDTKSGCASRMSDGRAFTDYRSSCRLNSLFRKSNNIIASHEYRMHLTHNATDLINSNSVSAWNVNGCDTCKNLCLGTDETVRPGNSTPVNFSNCIPPSDYLRYNGAIPVKGNVLKRSVVPSGGSLVSEINTDYTSFPPAAF
jgi:hypothetical protein